MSLFDAVPDELRKVLKGRTLNLYARVSTGEDQKIAGQIADLEEFGEAAKKALPIKGYRIWTDDGVSGTTSFNERPGGSALLKAIKKERKGSQVVLSRDAARLARNEHVAGWIIEELGFRNAPFITLDAGKNPKLVSRAKNIDYFDLDDEFIVGLEFVFASREVRQDIEKSARGVRQAILLGKFSGVPQPLYDWKRIFEDYFTGSERNPDRPGKFLRGRQQVFLDRYGLHHSTWSRQFARYERLLKVAGEEGIGKWLDLYDDLRAIKAEYGPREDSKITEFVRTYSERNLKEPDSEESLLRAPDIPALEAAARQKFPSLVRGTEQVFGKTVA